MREEEAKLILNEIYRLQEDIRHISTVSHEGCHRSFEQMTIIDNDYNQRIIENRINNLIFIVKALTQ